MRQKKDGGEKAIKHISTYGLALFLILTPFEYPLADLISVSPLRLVGIFAMGLACLDLLFQRNFKIDYRVVFIACWLLYGLATYFWAIDKVRWQSYYSIYFNNALMFLLFSMVSFTKREAEILKKSTVFGVGALLLYMTFVPNAIIYSEYQKRMTLNAGVEGLDQNYLAALMLIAFGIVFYNLCNNFKQKMIYKILSIIFCVAIVYYALLTGSRSGVIAICIIVLLSINTSWKTRLAVGIPIIIFIIVVLPLIVQYLPEEILERFTRSALTGQESESGTRLIIWKHALSSLHGPEVLFGYGAGASQTVVGNALGRGDAAIHNHYIAMVVEFGIIGFLLVNIPIFLMLKETAKKDKSIVIAFLGIVLMTFFLDVVTTKFFWSAMILLSACCSAHKNIVLDGGE